MPELINYIFTFILLFVGFYKYVLIASVILSWLLAFNIINTSNEMVAKLIYIIHRATDPILSPIRKFLPSFGGLDFSPIVAFFILGLIELGLSRIGNFLITLFL